MGTKFIKNVLHMFSGNLLLLLIAFISMPIYIRAVGLSDYAILGIVFSFFDLILMLDLPFFLTLVKSWQATKIKRNAAFEQLFSTIYTFILLTNAIIFIPLVLLVFILSNWIYKNPSLIPFYLLGLVVFIINRASNYLELFLRSRKEEVWIQKAFIVSRTSEFLFAMAFLFIFNLGVMSIFLSVVIKETISYSVLSYSSRKLIKYSFSFNPSILIEPFKKYTFHEYLYKSTDNLTWRSGLFVSTFFLSRDMIGILTIFFSLEENLRRFTSKMIFSQLIPIFSYLLSNKEFFKIKRIIQNINFFLLLLSIFTVISLITIGSPIYYTYYGEQLKGTYFAFLMFIFSVLTYICSIPSITYLFVSNPKLLSKINVYLFLLFLIILVILVKTHSIFGLIITYLIYFSVYRLIISFLIKKSFRNIFFAERNQIITLLILQIIGIFIYSKSISIEPFFMLLYFLIITILVTALNLKKIIAKYKFLMKV